MGEYSGAIQRFVSRPRNLSAVSDAPRNRPYLHTDCVWGASDTALRFLAMMVVGRPTGDEPVQEKLTATGERPIIRHSFLRSKP